MKRLLIALALALPCAAQFADTSNNVATAASIMYLRGIANGCAPSAFCPSNPVLRQEAATFLVRAIYSATTGDPENFTYTLSPAYFPNDMPSTSVYYPYVQKLADLGLTTGCSPNTFCSTANVTKGEMAVFIARARQIIMGQPTVGAPDCSPWGGGTCATHQTFPADTGPYATWAHDYVEYVYLAQGFTALDGCNTPSSFCSGDAATRGKVALDIISGVYNGMKLEYPTVDRQAVTDATVKTGGQLIPWLYTGGYTYPGVVSLQYNSPMNPMPFTTLSMGCNGPGSNDLQNGITPYFNYAGGVWYGTGSCRQIWVRIVNIAGYKYDYTYYTPNAVGTSVVDGSLVDTTPGVITVPPNSKKGPTMETTTDHVVVSTASGRRVRVPRGDAYRGEVPYKYTRTKDGWRYQYDISELEDVMNVHLGMPHDDLTVGSPASETNTRQMDPQSAQPDRWTPFLANGWMSVLFDEGVPGSGTFAMTSARRPGLIPIYLQGDVLGLRKLKHIKDPESFESGITEPTIDDTSERLSALSQEKADMRRAIHWSYNASQRFVIGPAINADAGRGEVLLQVKRWVEDFDFEFLRPLIGIEGDEALSALTKVRPSTPLERDIVACLKDALK